MTETLAALLLAHVLADFVLQSNAMGQSKLLPRSIALHGLIVLASVTVTLGSFSPWLLALAGVHLAIDLAMTLYRLRGIWPFLADQAAHLASLIALALLAPDLWTTGLWQPHSQIPALMALTAGAILPPVRVALPSAC